MQDPPALKPHIRNRPLAKLCLRLDPGNPAHISGGNLTSHLNNAVQWCGSGLYFLRLFQLKYNNSLDCVWDENAFQSNSTDAGIRSDLTNHGAGAGYSTAPAQWQKYLPMASPDNFTLKGSKKVLRAMARLQKLLEQWVQLPVTSKLRVCTWSLETRSVPSLSPPATMKFWSEQNSAQTREESFHLKKLH